MALIQKTDPVGIDIPIDRLQKHLFDNLTWKDATNGYESFHRAYINKSNGSNEAEVFETGIDYNEVFTNDNLSATSFFLRDNDSPITNVVTSTVHIIFQVNLKELYPLIEHRADEEAHRDVYNILQRNPWINFDLTGFTKGIEGVYEALRIEQINFDDMQPFHVFKYTLTITHKMEC